MTIHTQPAAIDSIKKSLVALKMPRALEMLDTALRRVEQGEITWIEALDQLLIEELTLRDNRRVSTALRMSRLTTVKTLAGFDFAFQPSLDRHRILALAELKFIDRAEVVHLLGPPGTSHLATALAVEAVKAGKSVAFATLADIVTALAKARCASVCGSSPAPPFSSSTRSATCRSCPAAVICSSSLSTPATRKAR
jgi:DNA replication protein DnaC